MAYNVSDRMKEWTSFAGAAVAAASIVIPQFVPVAAWVHYWADAQLVLGAALVLIPQSAGTTAVENEALSLLQAISAKVPAEYAAAVLPAINLLTRVTSQLPTAPVAVVPVVPQPVVPVHTTPPAPVVPQVVAGVLVPPGATPVEVAVPVLPTPAPLTTLGL